MGDKDENIDLTEDEKAGLSEEELAAIDEDEDEELGLTDEERAGLSDEELEAIGDDGDEDDSADDADDSADEDADDEEAQDEDADADLDDGDVAAVADADGDADGTDDADQASDDDAEAVTTAAVPETFAPKFNQPLAEDHDEKVAAVAEKFENLEKEYDDGDLSHKDYMTKFRAITSEESELRMAESIAKMSQEQNTQTAEQHWAWEQENFFNVPANTKMYADPMTFDALNGEVKRIVASEESLNLTARQILEKADKNVRTRFGSPEQEVKDEDEEVDEAKGKKAKGKKPKPRKPNLKEVKQSLGKLPAADADTDVKQNNKFAHLDDLKGIELENALASLSPNDEAEYLKETG